MVCIPSRRNVLWHTLCCLFSPLLRSQGLFGVSNPLQMASLDPKKPCSTGEFIVVCFGPGKFSSSPISRRVSELVSVSDHIPHPRSKERQESSHICSGTFLLCKTFKVTTTKGEINFTRATQLYIRHLANLH